MTIRERMADAGLAVLVCMILWIVAFAILLAGCTSVTVRPVLDPYSGVPLTTAAGFPIPEIESRSWLQERDIEVWFEQTPTGGVSVHYKRKDIDKSVDLIEVLRQAMRDGALIAAGGAAGAAAGGVVP